MSEDTSPIPALPRARWAHVPVAVVAVLVGLICGLPHVLMGLQAQREGLVYAPLVAENVSALTYDETTYYAPQVREVMDGRPLSADPAGHEHKGGRRFLGQSWVDSLIGGLLGLLVHRSVPNVFIVGDFLLPPLSFLLLWALCRRLGAPSWVAIAAALMSVLAHDLVILPLHFLTRPSLDMVADRLNLFSSTRPVEFTRFSVPQLSFIFCAGAILGLVNLYLQPRPRRAVLTGILVGLVFYSYVYYWTFVMVGGLLLLAAGLLTGHGRRAAGMLGVALGVGVVVGLPVVYQLLAPAGFAGKEEFITRLNWAGAQINWWNQKHDLVLLVLLVALYPKRRPEFMPLGAFLLAPFACILAARALGMNTQEWHWLGRCWQPWSAVVAVMLIWALLGWAQDRRARQGAQEEKAPSGSARSKAARTQDIIFGGLSILVLLYTANNHLRFSSQMAEAYTMPPELHQVLQELELRAEHDSVVAALDTNLLALVPVYSHCSVFLPYCQLTPAPAQELMERAAALLAAYGVGEEGAAELLRGAGHLSPQDRALFRHFGRNWAWWLFLVTQRDGSAPPGAEQSIQALAQFYGPDALQETADRYRADFMFWGPLERELGDPELEKALAPGLFIEAGDYRVYRVGPERAPVLREAE